MTARVALLETFAPEVRPRLRELAGPGIEIAFTEADDDDARRAALAHAEYAVVRAVPLSARLLDHAPKLRMIHQWGTGIDGIPLGEALARGIEVARSPGRNAPSVADLTLGLMLACLRRIPQGDARIRQGHWAEPDLYETGRDLAGATVGLVGFGAIGAQVARRLTGFDCEVLYTRASGPIDGQPGFRPLDDLLAAADVVSLHLPLTSDTRGLLDAGRLARMKPGAVLINTARGGLLDERALAEALGRGHLGAAGLDAFEVEPLPDQSPLRSAPNTVFSAHSGGRTRDNFARIVRHWAGNITRHAAGETIDQDCRVTK